MSLAFTRFWRKLACQLHRGRLRRELAEELAEHERLKVEQYAAGLPAGAAAAQARLDMGNLTLAAEQAAEIRSYLWLEHLAQDIRHATRLFHRYPAFTLVATLSLALGIAGNTAVFSMVNALLIKPLPFADPGRLVRITEFYPKALLVYLQQRCRTMDIASVSPGYEMNVTGQGPAFRITGSGVSANLFSVLGAPVSRGRAFEKGEDQPGRDRVAIISYTLWTSRFHAAPEVIDRTILVNGTPRRIVGIMPADFAFPTARVELWYPAALNPGVMEDYWGGEFTPLIGRLRAGATLAQAKAEIRSLAAGVWMLFPFYMPRHWNANATVISLQTDLAGDARSRLLVLLCAVGAVLVIACANVASLSMARATTRQREIALRAALGASRLRIVRQLLTESVVLALIAGAAGILLGGAAVGLFRSVLSPDLPGAARVSIDWNVAAFTAGLSFLAGLSLGLAPALSASWLNLMETVKTGGQRATPAGSLRVRSGLIAAEVALTLVLVIAASLLSRSVYALSKVDPGFTAQRVLAVKISPDPSFCAHPARCLAFYGRLLDEARSAAGVTGAALANTVPLDGLAPSIPADVEDHPKSADYPSPMLWTGAITPGYLNLMGIPLLAGRGFADTDTAVSEPVLLVTASTARRFWPGQNPIGKHIKVVWEAHWRTIVGVVADVRQFNLANRAPSSLSGAIYMPYPQAVDSDHQIPGVMDLIVKTAGDGSLTEDELRQIAVAGNPDIPVSKVMHLEQLVGASVANFRSTTWIFLSFAVVALVLAAIGIYGLVAYSVAQRSHEISVRMAVGATQGGIIRMVVATSLRVVLAGMVAGIGGALLMTRALSALLFGVGAMDPLIYAGMSVFLLGTGALASLAPAWRASRRDPIRNLRAE